MVKEDPLQAGKYVNHQIELSTGKTLTDNILQHAFGRIAFTDKLDKVAIQDFCEIMKKLEIIPAHSNLDGIYEDTYLENTLKNS